MKFRGTLNYGHDNDLLHMDSFVFEGQQVRMSLRSHECKEIPQGYHYVLPDLVAAKSAAGVYKTGNLECTYVEDDGSSYPVWVSIELNVSQSGLDVVDIVGSWIEKDEQPVFSGRLHAS